MLPRAQELWHWPESMPFGAFFEGEAWPWAWLPQIKAALAAFDFDEAEELPTVPPGVTVEGPVYLHPTVQLPPYALFRGPAWIGEGVEVRPGAYVRGNVIVGAGSVLGNACEYKNCLLLEGVETPHYNYVGDSVLGNQAHLGAGAICANLRLDRQEVILRHEGERYATGLRKVGALMGDGAEVGCNSVLQPGAILGRRAAVISMPFSGYLPADTLAMPKNEYVTLARRG